jgi:tetratricopeptide (TPR) repeat protein
MPELGEAAIMDTSMLFNAAIMSMKGKDFESAAEIFEQVIGMGYNGFVFTGTSTVSGETIALRSKADADKQMELQMITEYAKSETLRPSTYISLISCYKQTENKDKYKSTLKAARTEFPEDVDLINLEIQDYLDAEQYDEALAILDEAIAQSPDNKLYYYVKGSLYQNHKKDIELALANYEKALEVDPEYLDALYMCGLVYVERANQITEEINDLPGSATKKYNELKAKQKSTFEKALPYFEKAHSIDAEDLDTIKALREVYYKTGDKVNYAKMNELLN